MIKKDLIRPSIKTPVPGPKSLEYLEFSKQFEPQSIKRQFPVVWKKAVDVIVEDVDGNRFLDFTSSVMVANIGHTHPRLQKVLKEQIQENIHSYNFLNPWRALLCKRLIEISDKAFDRVFVATTGAEVVELALNSARQYTGKTEILSFFGGYHGKTFGAVSAGGKSQSRKGLGSVMPGIIHAPYPYCYRCDFGKTYPECELQCFKFIEKLLQCTGMNDLAAVIVEPLQGNSGQIEPPKKWMIKLFEFCKKQNVLLIFDETQTSFGRTGELFAYRHFDMVPDLLIAGKGISSGIPLTVLLGRSEILDHLRPDSLSSTHGGNPLAMRAALETIDILFEEKLIENSKEVGTYLYEHLKNLKNQYEMIGDVRGTGLMIGIEIIKDPVSKIPAPQFAKKIVDYAIVNGLLLIQPIGFYGNVIRIAPPLTLTHEEADIGLNILANAFKSVMAEM